MNNSIYTIGHSNISIENFIEMLHAHEIKTLVDVRSSPFARYADWFNGPFLEKELIKNKIKYRFAGEHLGGRPKGNEYYLADNCVNYRKMSESKIYKEGLERLKELASINKTVIMCSEKKYSDCHRNLLIAKTLGSDWSIHHIIDKDSIEPYSSAEQASFELGEEGEQWKSTLPVSRDG